MSRTPENIKSALLEFGVKTPVLSEKVVNNWLTALSAEYPIFPAAKMFLREFGGLVINESGKGEDISKSNIHLDPTALLGEGEFIADHEEIAGTKLFPIGTANHKADYLVLGEDGCGYWINAGGVFQYKNGEELILSLVRGKKGTQIWPT